MLPTGLAKKSAMKSYFYSSQAVPSRGSRTVFSKPIKAKLLPLLTSLLLLSCNGALTRFLTDQAAGSAFTLTTSPANGATIGSLAQIDVTFSKPPTGATTLANYALSGAGVGTLAITGASLLSGMTYRLAISGSVANGTITLLSLVSQMPKEMHPRPALSLSQET